MLEREKEINVLYYYITAVIIIDRKAKVIDRYR